MFRSVVSYLYMCRLRGPSRVQDEGPEAAGPELTDGLFTAVRLNGLEWSNKETAIEARVLAPGGHPSTHTQHGSEILVPYIKHWMVLSCQAFIQYMRYGWFINTHDILIQHLKHSVSPNSRYFYSNR